MTSKPGFTGMSEHLLHPGDKCKLLEIVVKGTAVGLPTTCLSLSFSLLWVILLYRKL